MRRRDLITLFDASAAPGPLAARAQLPVMRVIDTSILVPPSGRKFIACLSQGAERLPPGRNVAIEYRWGKMTMIGSRSWPPIGFV
jgi:hypothetical protein